jgi:helix-turn-helix protein
MQATIADAARMLRVSEHTIRRRVRSGELPSSQVDTPQGFIWMVELPDEVSRESPASGEVVAMRELIASLNEQVQTLKGQLAAKDTQLDSKDRQIEQLHVLLQQAQAALPVPKEVHHSWWRRLLRY